MADAAGLDLNTPPTAPLPELLSSYAAQPPAQPAPPPPPYARWPARFTATAGETSNPRFPAAFTSQKTAHAGHLAAPLGTAHSEGISMSNRLAAHMRPAITNRQ